MKVVSVSCSPRHAFSKAPQPAIRLIAGEGVEGDAHRGRTTQHLYRVRQDPTLPNLCQVHLFATEMLEELRGNGFEVEPGELGENILTNGIDLLSLPLGTVLQIGLEAVVEITGLRTPCSQIDKFRPGLQQHLWGASDVKGKKTRRAGVMGVVRVGGCVRPEDAVSITLPPEPHKPLPPV